MFKDLRRRSIVVLAVAALAGATLTVTPSSARVASQPGDVGFEVYTGNVDVAGMAKLR